MRGCSFRTGPGGSVSYRVNGEEMIQTPPPGANAHLTEYRGRPRSPSTSPPRARQRSDSLENFDRWCDSLRHANSPPAPQYDQVFDPFDAGRRSPNCAQVAAAAEHTRYPPPPPYQASHRSNEDERAPINRELLAAAAENRRAQQERRDSVSGTERNTGNVQRQGNSTQPGVRCHPSPPSNLS
jgi:hypothetical protein